MALNINRRSFIITLLGAAPAVGYIPGGSDPDPILPYQFPVTVPAGYSMDEYHVMLPRIARGLGLNIFDVEGRQVFGVRNMDGSPANSMMVYFTKHCPRSESVQIAKRLADGIDCREWL